MSNSPGSESLGTQHSSKNEAPSASDVGPAADPGLPQRSPDATGVCDNNDDLDPEEVRQWAEFCAWSALVMTPIIWWLQGPSVSTDQFYVRSGLVVISLVTAVCLRIWALREKRLAPVEATKNPS